MKLDWYEYKWRTLFISSAPFDAWDYTPYSSNIKWCNQPYLQAQDSSLALHNAGNQAVVPKAKFGRFFVSNGLSNIVRCFPPFYAQQSCFLVLLRTAWWISWKRLVDRGIYSPAKYFMSARHEGEKSNYLTVDMFLTWHLSNKLTHLRKPVCSWIQRHQMKGRLHLNSWEMKAPRNRIMLPLLFIFSLASQT